MSRFRVIASDRLPAEVRLRIGLAAVSVLVAISLAALLGVLSLLRGVPPSPAMLIGIALGLGAELLCLDVALRRVRRRLGGVDGMADASRPRRPACRASTAAPAAR